MLSKINKFNLNRFQIPFIKVNNKIKNYTKLKMKQWNN